MKCFSLFSGIGGFDLALTRQGYTMVGACEIDKHARAVYARHFPGVKIHEDATQINPDNLPDFDILVAGFPCQAFSIAGKRRGFEDTRGTLFFEIARIAKQKRPQYMLLENVKGLLSHDGGQTVRKIYQTLDELGYDTESRIINTKNFLPQNRERIFIICSLRGSSRREIFPVRDSIQQSDKRNPKEQVANSLQCPGHSCGNYKGMTMIVESKLKQIGKINNSQSGMIYSIDGITPTLNANGGGQGAKTGLYVVDETRIRRLTPMECERLQGFPNNYTKLGKDGEIISDTQRYRMCGNAVTVIVVEYIISKLALQKIKNVNEVEK